MSLYYSRKPKKSSLPHTAIAPIVFFLFWLYSFDIFDVRINLMTITQNQSDEKLVMALEGRLDTITAPDLQEQLIPGFDKTKHIQLDFRRLIYVSSAGLRILLMGEKTAKAKGGKMTLVNVSAEIKEIFEMTGFSEVLTVVD
jgi:anti-anti-sigma factor